MGKCFNYKARGKQRKGKISGKVSFLQGRGGGSGSCWWPYTQERTSNQLGENSRGVEWAKVRRQERVLFCHGNRSRRRSKPLPFSGNISKSVPRKLPTCWTMALVCVHVHLCSWALILLVGFCGQEWSLLSVPSGTLAHKLSVPGSFKLIATPVKCWAEPLL